MAWKLEEKDTAPFLPLGFLSINRFRNFRRLVCLQSPFLHRLLSSKLSQTCRRGSQFLCSLHISKSEDLRRCFRFCCSKLLKGILCSWNSRMERHTMGIW